MADAQTLDFQKEQARLLRADRATKNQGGDFKNAEQNVRQSARGRLQRAPLTAVTTHGDGSSVFNTIRGPAQWLRFAWLSFLPSWGLTTLYFPIHALGRLILPKVFCKFGEEWPGISQAPGVSIIVGGAEKSTVIIIIALQILLLIGMAGVVVVILTALGGAIENPFIQYLVERVGAYIIPLL